MQKLTKKKKAVIITVLIITIAIVSTFLIDKNLIPTVWVCALVAVLFFNLCIFIKKDLSEDNYQKNLIQAAGFGIIAISWFVSGYINNQQSILQKKRDLKVKFLIDAYFKLVNSDNRAKETPTDSYIYSKFQENAINEIQLVGDSKVVNFAQLYTISGGKEHFSDLLIQLREDLRKELNVSPLFDLIPYEFRIENKLPIKDSLTSEEQINLIIKLNEEHQDLIK